MSGMRGRGLVWMAVLVGVAALAAPARAQAPGGSPGEPAPDGSSEPAPAPAEPAPAEPALYSSGKAR